MQRPTANEEALVLRSPLSKLIHSYNPGITLLVVLWTAAFALRERLLKAGPIDQLADNAIKSLLLVIPIMLAGWAVLTVVDRRYRLGLFR
ncbi:MAG: hypothetical protein ABI442_06185 [Gemmatimonadaceae bacterium]